MCKWYENSYLYEKWLLRLYSKDTIKYSQGLQIQELHSTIREQICINCLNRGGGYHHLGTHLSMKLHEQTYDMIGPYMQTMWNVS